MKSILFFFFLVVSVHANYCVQVKSAIFSSQKWILNEAKKKQYQSYKNLRIEKRGQYLVLRVGDFKSYKEAIPLLKDLRVIEEEAYIRKCDFESKKALYIHNATRSNNSPKTLQTKQKYISDKYEDIDIIEIKQAVDTSKKVQPKKLQTKQIKVEKKAIQLLQDAYNCSLDSNRSKAYNLFSKAIEFSNEKDIYDKACKGVIINAPLRRKYFADPYYLSLYGEMEWFKRTYHPQTLFQRDFEDIVYQFKVRYGRFLDTNKKISSYLFMHIDGDTKSKGGSIPIIYSDNYMGVGLGVDYRPIVSTRIFGEFSLENNLLSSDRDRYESNYRLGLEYYKQFGKGLDISCSYDFLINYRWFADIYLSTIFYSRYEDNVIAQQVSRIGTQIVNYRYSNLLVYLREGITADTNGDFYNNIIEIGPGLEMKPYQEVPFSVRLEYRFSKYFKNVTTGSTDRFNTLLLYLIFNIEK